MDGAESVLQSVFTRLNATKAATLADTSVFAADDTEKLKNHSPKGPSENPDHSEMNEDKKQELPAQQESALLGMGRKGDQIVGANDVSTNNSRRVTGKYIEQQAESANLNCAVPLKIPPDNPQSTSTPAGTRRTKRSYRALQEEATAFLTGWNPSKSHLSSRMTRNRRETRPESKDLDCRDLNQQPAKRGKPISFGVTTWDMVPDSRLEIVIPLKQNLRRDTYEYIHNCVIDGKETLSIANHRVRQSQRPRRQGNGGRGRATKREPPTVRASRVKEAPTKAVSPKQPVRQGRPSKRAKGGGKYLVNESRRSLRTAVQRSRASRKENIASPLRKASQRAADGSVTSRGRGRRQ
ncbi:uncharacterized protein UV8b_00082 [Ustilaginoidea virens]|uniref:Uncharacterized protein n=1 Tax=Ustilaginoidea virens TaxID=1159556 RepID=A0A063BMQ8_USTVR|nr:uncharacterized protein UV8b_00082 [Ustilaginoidea virens]QUC15841.1 hypothetical protein UV8b_00082 [Ustilaginoidea virens]GAO19236.1 hypothetical protein UVI_02060480 [Ustilaginoidea virens]